MTIALTDDLKNAFITEIGTQLSGGNLLIQTAADADVATLTLSSASGNAINTPTAGSATFKTVTADADAAGGIATKFAMRSSGDVSMFTGTVGTSNSDLIIANTTVVEHSELSAGTLTISYADADPFPGIDTIGEYVDVTITAQTMRMIYANDSTSRTFPTGGDDSGSAELTRKFFIAETEITNAQAVEILQWAYNNSKFNASNGSAHNYLSSTVCRYGGRSLIDLSATGNGDESYNVQIAYSSGTFSVRNSMGDYPVSNITWFGGVMLANWLTEMKDGNTSNVVYTGIPTDGSTWNSYSTTVVDFSKTGYRLPTLNEWEYAARYRGTDSTNTVAGYSSPYYTQGDSASGATADYNNASASAAVAVYGTSALAVVKSKTANTLGLYDMTGNLWEWFEAYGTNSAYDAGSCWERAGDQYLGIGNNSSNLATDGTWDMGVRLAKTQA